MDTHDHTDNTGARIRAFLASARPFDGADELEAFITGRELIERLADCSRDTDPPGILLTLNQCADVLHFLARVEPLKALYPKDGPSPAVGREMVLLTLEESLRRFPEHSKAMGLLNDLSAANGQEAAS